MVPFGGNPHCGNLIRWEPDCGNQMTSTFFLGQNDDQGNENQKPLPLSPGDKGRKARTLY